MTAPVRPPLEYQSPPPASGARDDLAYALPMVVFLVFTWAGSKLATAAFPAAYAIAYAAKTFVVAGVLVYFRRHYTRIRWDYWWLGVIVGVVGIFQWVGMQLWLQRNVELFKPAIDAWVFDPYAAIPSPAWRMAFFAVRIAGAVLLVPVMEELFWRDFLWRQVLAPNDFKLAGVGEWGWAPFLIISGAFALVHGNWWATSIVWALMIGALLVYTKSLGACIIAHAVTNALLAVYVLKTRDWTFW